MMMSKALISEVDDLVARIQPLLAGREPQVQGSVLVVLLSIWLNGHHAGSLEASRRLRREILELHSQSVLEYAEA